jgi:hypothetical protein
MMQGANAAASAAGGIAGEQMVAPQQ